MQERPNFLEVGGVGSTMETIMTGKSIRIMIVDDHVMVRKGMKAFLQEFEEIQVVGDASDGWKAIELVKQLKPDVVLVDLLMPGMDGIETTERLIAIQPKLGVLVLTAYADDDKVSQAIKAGALGYLVKDAQPEELVQSIKIVSAGAPALSPKIAWKVLHGIRGTGSASQKQMELSDREAEVLRLLTRGKTDQEIANQLVLSEVTIRSHVARILAKLGLHNRVQAALYGIRSGMVSLEETREFPEMYY